MKYNMKKIVWLVGTLISMNAAVGMIDNDNFQDQTYIKKGLRLRSNDQVSLNISFNQKEMQCFFGDRSSDKNDLSMSKQTRFNSFNNSSILFLKSQEWNRIVSGLDIETQKKWYFFGKSMLEESQKHDDFKMIVKRTIFGEDDPPIRIDANYPKSAEMSCNKKGLVRSWCSRFCDACFNGYSSLIQRMGECLSLQYSWNSACDESITENLLKNKVD